MRKRAEFAMICPFGDTRNAFEGQFCNLIFYSIMSAYVTARTVGPPSPPRVAGGAVVMSVGQSLIIELEKALRSGSKDRRINALRRVTDLFVADADRLSDQQINVFDEVLGHLIERIEARARAELSHRLAPIHNAPTEVLRRLARDDDIAVADPILKASAQLSDSDLVEIANSKTQAHLLAISARAQIGTTVTDVLLRRGNQDVFRTLAANSGAR